MTEERNFDDPNYRAWRRAVYARDGHRCQMPGCRRTKYLNAHHIQRWADAPLLRFVVSNGITLCPRCHKRVTGREEDFAVQLQGIIASRSPSVLDVRLKLLMKKYGTPAPEEASDVHGDSGHP